MHPITGATALLAGLLTIHAHAAPFQFNDGDLILGIRASSGTGSTKNVFLNLGSGVSHRDNGNLGKLADIGATLASVYGADWYDRGNLYFGVIGNLSPSSASGFGSAPPVNGDPSRTFYISAPTSAPGASELIAEGSYVSAALGSAGTKFSGMEQMLVGTTEVAGLDQRSDGTAILDQGLQPVQWNNGWTAWNPVSGAAFDVFSGGIQQSFGKGGSATVVDIQRILATNTGANPAGTVGGGTYETSISISSSGVVTAFTPLPSLPELDVDQPAGAGLTTGAATIRFGSVVVGQSGSKIVFTIQSAGTGPLTLSSLNLIGANPGDFLITGPSSMVLPASTSADFTVQFAPSAIGSRSATLRIVSDDVDESPFEIQFTGTAVTLAPEIHVEQPAATAMTDGVGSRNLGTNLAVGASGSPFTFTIRNTGNAALTGITITKAGSNPLDFMVSGPAVTTLAPSGSATFTVLFQPKAAGNRSADLRIVSNDGDENPFDIRVTGSAFQPVPEIAVAGPGGAALVDGQGSLKAGKVVVGKSGKPLSFVIKNIGTANISGIKLSVAGKNRSNFLVKGPAVTDLAPGASTRFTVVFKPTAGGSRSAVIRLASNDADENPFKIATSGTAVLPTPEIVVQQPAGSSLVDGKTQRTFGTVALGKTTTRVFTIRNVGSANLSGLAVVNKGAQAKDFTVAQPARKSLAPGTSTTFRVVFKPGAKGTRSTAIRIKSNDSDENPFDLKLAGFGAAR